MVSRIRLIQPSVVLRALILISWMLLFVLLLQRDYLVKNLDVREQETLARSREESFMGIYFREERIGYVKNRVIPAGDETLQLIQDSFLRLNILDKNYPVRMTVTATLTRGHILKDFLFSLSSPFYAMDATGSVQGREVRFTLKTGKEEIADKITLAREPFLSTNQRAYLLTPGLKPGDRLKIPYFDPISLSGKDTVVEYKGWEKLLVRGRIFNLHHFTETFSGIRINSWLDEKGRVIQEESPAGFVFIAEPEFQATDIKSQGKEILSSVSVPANTLLPEVETLSFLRLRLGLPPEVEFALNKDRQIADNDILSIRRETFPAPDSKACTGPPDTLASTPYIQAQNVEIARQTEAIVDPGMRPLEKVRAIGRWVFTTLEKRPVLGIPDALTVLDTKMGDCNEHAVLFAALARHAQIPTRVAAGVMYYDGAFFYHAWNEVCVGDRWLSVDTTRNQFPADVGHIKFVEGETQEQVKIGALLGNLKIEILNYE